MESTYSAFGQAIKAVSFPRAIWALLFLFSFHSHRGFSDDFETSFQEAASRFDVPVWVLRTRAHIETRTKHITHDPREDETYADHEHAPPVYGVMGLTEAQLARASTLIRKPVESLIKYPKINILGGAALIAEAREKEIASRKILATQAYSTDSVSRSFAWKRILESASELPAADQDLYGQSVALALKDKPFLMGMGLPEGMNTQDPAEEPDYPEAKWDASPNFTEGAIQVRFVVIHTTQGNFAGSVSHLKNPLTNASAHYVIRSADGFIKQLVHHKDKAWHARCWNSTTIGIEHEGYVNNPDWYTEEMYLASSKLSAYLSKQYAIPIHPHYFVGHGFWADPTFPDSPLAEIGACNNHKDPGIHWNWTKYFDLIKQSMR